MNEMQKAVVTVLGVDRKGIIARVSQLLFENDANILDINQTILGNMFNMVLIADISSAQCSFQKLSDALSALGQEMGLQVRIQRSEIFEAMYQI